MKRIWSTVALLLALLLFAACQPTPEQEYVVYKGDKTPLPKVPENTVSASVVEGTPSAEEASTAPSDAPVFPARWEEVQEVRGATVTYRADVITRADGRFPLYRLRELKPDAAWRERILSAVLPRPVAMQNDGMTREDYTEAFRQYLAQADRQRDWIEHGFPEWDDVDEGLTDLDELEQQQQEIAALYQDRILNAPETLETVKKTDYRDVPIGTIRFELETGENAYAVATERGLTVTRYRTWLFEQSEYRHLHPYPICKPYDENWQDVTMPEDAAKEALDSLLATLDLSDFAIARAYKVNLFEGDIDHPSTIRRIAACWCFELSRSFGGYPVESQVLVDDRFLSYEGSRDAYSAPVFQESLRIMLNEDGVQYLSCSDPKEVVGLDAASAALLPFDEAQQRIRNAMSMSLNVDALHVGYFQGKDPAMQVFRVMLTAFPVRLPNSDEYSAVPCYLVFFDYDEDWRTETWTAPDASFQVLAVNAIDGSIIHPGHWY